MRINMYIIRDYIRGISSISRLNSDRLECKLCSAGIYNIKSVLKADTVYVASANDVDAKIIPEGACLLLSGAPADALLSTPADIIWTPEPCDLTILIQAVMEVFSIFNAWENTLYDAYGSSDPLQALGDSSLQFFRNPFSLYSRSFYVLRFFENCVDGVHPFHYPDEKGTYLQEEITSSLLVDSAFLESWNTEEPALYYLDTGVDRCLYQNIPIAGENKLRLVIAETNSPFKESDYPILAHLVKQYERFFQLHGNINVKAHEQDLEECIVSLLNGEPVNAERIQAVYAHARWSAQDSFVCMDISSPQDEKTGSLEMACVRLEQRVPDSIAIPIQNHIFLLADLSRSKSAEHALPGLLSEYLRENMMKAGISSEFTDITRVRHLYNQARLALETGQRVNPSLWSFNAEDYKLAYFLSCCGHDIQPRYMFPRGLLALIDYDEKKGRSYTNTLRVFLECNMGITATTQKLFMHRQTFLYQLERIKKISCLDLDNPDVRLHLLISFKLMEMTSSDSYTADAQPQL